VLAILVLFGPVVVTCAAGWVAYRVLRRRPSDAALVAVGAFVLQVLTAVAALSLVSGEALYCTQHPNAGAAGSLAFAAAALGGASFGGTVVATRGHPASAAALLLVAAIPYVVLFFAYVVIC
jgi:hypothetical protein